MWGSKNREEREDVKIDLDRRLRSMYGGLDVTAVCVTSRHSVCFIISLFM